jgi:predicted MFS family arabinose efflux permease
VIRALADNYRASLSGLPRSVWLLATVTLVNRSGTMVLPFLALYLTKERGFTATEAGAVLSVYGVGAMGGAYLGGWLCDLLAPRKIMQWSLILTGLGFFMLGAAGGATAITIMVLGLSMVGEAFRPANAAALAESSEPDQRVRAMALSRLAVNLGMTFGPAAGGILAQYSYAWLFLADGGTCLLAAALLGFVFRGAGDGTRARTGGDVEKRMGASPLKDLPYLALLGLMTLLAVVIFQLFSTWPVYLHARYGFSEAGIGFLLAINTVVIVLAQMMVLHAIRGIHPLKAAGLGAFLFSAGFALLPLGSGYAFVAFTVLVWTAGEMLSLPLIEGTAANRAGEGSRGRYMGLFSVSFSAAFILAPLAGTWIYQHRGPETLWWSCGALGLLMWAGFRALSARMEKARPPGS